MNPPGAPDAGDQETDTYLDLNLHPPGYEFDCERGRNGASTSTDPASNGTDHDVEVADPAGNIHIRSMISVAGYCPVCGCSGVGYQRTYATDAANAEGSDEADVAGSGEEDSITCDIVTVDSDAIVIRVQSRHPVKSVTGPSPLFPKI